MTITPPITYTEGQAQAVVMLDRAIARCYQEKMKTVEIGRAVLDAIQKRDALPCDDFTTRQLIEEMAYSSALSDRIEAMELG